MKNQFEFNAENIEVPLNNEGQEKYEIRDNEIGLNWKRFLPDNNKSEELNSDSAILFLPGWSITEKAESIKPLCQEFANYSKKQTYAVKTRAEKITPDAMNIEAEAVSRMIVDKNLKDLTLIGSSLGGVETLHLAGLMADKNPEIKINGVVLLDAMSLYKQEIPALAKNYLKETVNTKKSLDNPPYFSEKDQVREQYKKYVQDGVSEKLKEIFRSNINYPKRTLAQIKDMVKLNPYLSSINVPIVLINGEQDFLSQPEKIVPDLENKDYKEREQFLKENIFTSSPYIRMIVPEKMGNHNLAYSRPESVAHSALYLLERWNRDQEIKNSKVISPEELEEFKNVHQQLKERAEILSDHISEMLPPEKGING
jgi:pimeloyl-ACP methyl ester carboxylesterase